MLRATFIILQLGLAGDSQSQPQSHAYAQELLHATLRWKKARTLERSNAQTTPDTFQPRKDPRRYAPSPAPRYVSGRSGHTALATRHQVINPQISGHFGS